ncbi:hypothetical protein KEM54_001847 [Ascosphaera aggregata]|nr:hypothetical protein KEM54_001847 [Ascosphaera aggregata]
MMYDASAEAVDLFYFVVDLCKTAKRRKKGSPSIDKLCAEYNKHIGNPYPTTADVAELFHKHHEFLMRQMNEGAEGVKWHKTLVYAYLSEHHPELARPIESFRKSSAKGKRASALAIRNSSSTSEESVQGRPESSPLLDSGDIESGTQSPSERNARGKIQKSILRPRTSSKGSGKGTKDPLIAEKGEKKRLIGRSNIDGDEDDSVSEASETPSRNSALDAFLDQFPSLPARPKKKSRLAVISTTTDDTSTTSDTNRDVSSAEDEQSLSTELPPDTWVCPVEGCPKLIYRASMRYAKDMISDHSLSHAHDTKGMLDLVFSEQRRNVNANVSHLVGRIKELAENRVPAGKREQREIMPGDSTTKEDSSLKSEVIEEERPRSITEMELITQTKTQTSDSAQSGSDDMVMPIGDDRDEEDEQDEDERNIQNQSVKDVGIGEGPRVKESPADSQCLL